MASTSSTNTRLGTGRPSGLSPAIALRALRVASALAVADLLWQFFSAGLILAGGHQHDSWVDPHGIGAIFLHIITGVMALAAAGYWYVTRGRRWPAVTAAVVFLLTFVQAAVGDDSILFVHIPGAMVVTAGIVTVAVWSFVVAGRVRH